MHVNFRGDHLFEIELLIKATIKTNRFSWGGSSSETIYWASYIDKRPRQTGYYLISWALYLRSLNLLISKISKNYDVLRDHNLRTVDHYQRMFVNYLYFGTVHNYSAINQHTFLWLWQFNCCFKVPKYLLSLFLFY